MSAAEKMLREFADSLSETQPPDGTSTLLVKHLKAKPQTPIRDRLIQRCEAFEYDDFKSPHATPKILLLEHLKADSYKDLAARVINGDYD